ncbi:MAG: LysM peptidoglycan-binding domain-containing protein [Hungatella hathewayi]|nr:LysM peptidoglycan-binding domain-containing protein [Hungatella hathewayi]
MQIYVVQTGDTVDTIAERQNVPVDTIIYNNQLIPPYRLAVGQALLLSSEGAGAPEGIGEAAVEDAGEPEGIGEAATEEGEAPAEPNRGTLQPDTRPIIHVNGYAYPFISRWVLNQTLPYLSELSIFSYGFTPEGNLVPPPLEEGWMIEAARNAGAVATLTLTPLGEDGHFNNNLIHILVTDLSAQQNLTRQLLMTMLEKGYGALNLDFEYIMAQDRLGYARFVGNITQMMNLFGIQVSVALAPKTSDEQEGVLYEGMDYALLGAAANSVLLMTYEWGYAYGPPMAIAPANLVRQVVEYAVTRIPREKISLGIPNYAYDWPLPFQSGITRARTIGNVEAVQLAILHGVEIQFDETAQSPYFRYWQFGVQHEVWFEDVRSYQAAFDIIKEFNLRGAGYWQIMQLFRANWLLLADTFEVEKRRNDS